MRLHQKPPTFRNRLLQRHDLLNFVTTLYEGDLHAKRVLSLANATLGVLASASLAIHAVGRGLAQAMGTLTKHGVKQVTSVPHFQDHASDNWEPEGAGSDGVVNRSWSGRRSNMLSWSTCSIW